MKSFCEYILIELIALSLFVPAFSYVCDMLITPQSLRSVESGIVQTLAKADGIEMKKGDGVKIYKCGAGYYISLNDEYYYYQGELS